jgi:RHH-type rel operon transcriptional repressor/antitoxin RelB
MLAIRLPLDVEQRLEDLAKATGRTKTYYAREAILEYLDDLEDIYVAEKRIENIRAGNIKTKSFNEILKDYDLAN